MKKLWATLKTMSFTEAADYIWEYYKIHILGIVLGGFFIGSIISTVLKEDPETYEVMVISEIPYDVIDDFSADINEQYFEEYEIMTDNIVSSGGGLGQQSPEQVQKFFARVAAGMIDVIVTDKVLAEELHSQEGLTKIEEMVDLSLLEDAGVETYQFGTEDVYAIDTNQLDVFNDNEFFQDRYLIFPLSSEKKDRTTSFLETLLEQ